MICVSVQIGSRMWPSTAVRRVHSIKCVFWRWCEDKEDEMLELATQNGSHPPHPQLVAIKLVDVLCKCCFTWN